MSLTYQQLEQAAVDEITHGCDGPVTAFVAMARAVRLAREQRYQPVDGGDDHKE